MEKKKLTEEQKEQIYRLRRIREDLGYSQEQFAEILGISTSAYKKIEAYEQQISLENLKRIYKKLNVSVDYILFGERVLADDIWNGVLNCTEADKMVIFLRLYRYFCESRDGIYPIKEDNADNVECIGPLLDSVKRAETKDGTKCTDCRG